MILRRTGPSNDRVTRDVDYITHRDCGRDYITDDNGQQMRPRLDYAGENGQMYWQEVTPMSELDADSPDWRNTDPAPLIKIIYENKPTENTMSKFTTVEQVTMINNVPADKHTDDDIICLIKQQEDAIAKLGEVKVKSEAITAKKAEMRKVLKRLVIVLDKRCVTED